MYFYICTYVHFSLTKLYRQFTYVLAWNGVSRDYSESSNVKIGK